MELKEISKRLEIIKLSISVNDSETIKVQSNYLKSLNSINLNEISSLLENRNYRQALYLIKKFKEDNNLTLVDSSFANDETENVLNIDDMLKMGPINQETINYYKESSYTQDDIAAFSQNISSRKENSGNAPTEEEIIELPPEEEITTPSKEETKETNLTYAKEKEESQKPTQLNKAIADANNDTPLDEISSQVLNKKEEAKRTQVISKYKTLRSKFAKKEKKQEETKKPKTSFASKMKNLAAKKKKPEIKKETIKEEQEELNKPNRPEKNDIYPPIPHIENKYRQAFILYPPIKESEVWVEEVAKFLRYIASNSYTDLDLNKFFDEYKHYLDNGDIARASQFILLAGCTDSRYSQFLVARELFKGKLLKRNIKKSYDLMSKLANSGYADAICDLGQFYEYGIGIPENKKTALKLYEKAFELGLQRATKHINRIKETQSGIFSTIKNLIK